MLNGRALFCPPLGCQCFGGGFATLGGNFLEVEKEGLGAEGVELLWDLGLEEYEPLLLPRKLELLPLPREEEGWEEGGWSEENLCLLLRDE